MFLFLLFAVWLVGVVVVVEAEDENATYPDFLPWNTLLSSIEFVIPGLNDSIATQGKKIEYL
jgi:hypothetical protein